MSIKKDFNGIWVSDSLTQISYPDMGSQNAFNLENKSFWFNHRNKIIETIIKRYPIDGDFVDVGGGNGYQLMKISELNPSNKNILIEPSYQGCLAANKRNIKEVYNIKFENFDFNVYNINGIGLFDVLEHIKNDEIFLSKLLCKLKKNSRIYISVPAHQFLWSDIDHYGGHYRRYNKKMVTKLSYKLDVDLEYFSYFFCYLLPISFLLRGLPYKFGKRISDQQLMDQENNQHNPKGVTKRVFNFLEKLELNKIARSKVGFGASCIFILRKN